MADKPLTKKDLEQITQKVAVVNEQTVKVENAADIAKPIVEEQKKNDLKKMAADIKMTSVFQDIASGVSNVGESLKEGLDGIAASFKEKGGKGLFNLGKILGIAAGVILAPVIAAGAFFKQIMVELKFLNKLSGGKLGKIFKPAIDFFRRIKIFFSRKGPFGGLIKSFKSLGKLTKLFGPITKGLKVGLSIVSKFAKMAGTLFGKLFLPITILMGIFDFVKGFMKGYKEEGIIGGITEGIVQVFDGLVGSLLRVLMWIPSKIAEVLGLENVAAGLTGMIDSMLDGIYSAFRGLVDIVVGIFTFDGPKILEGLTEVWTGITEFIGGIFEPFIGLVKDVFGDNAFEKLGIAMERIGLTISSFFANIKAGVAGIAMKIPFLNNAQWVKDMAAGSEIELAAIKKQRQSLDNLEAAQKAQQVVVVDSGSGSGRSGGSTTVNTYSPTLVNDTDQSTDALRRAYDF
jgi:hypothetical protein